MNPLTLQDRNKLSLRLRKRYSTKTKNLPVILSDRKEVRKSNIVCFLPTNPSTIVILNNRYECVNGQSDAKFSLN